MEFSVAGAAAVCAGFFTNPLEVLKTRMQLQGELSRKGLHAVHYRNVPHAALTIAKNEGVLALQKGLLPALGVQLVMNGLRMGIYQSAETRGLISGADGKLAVHKSALWSGLAGVVGQVCSNPLHLVKTHLQAQSVKSIAVGHQHHHRGTLHALNSIFRAQGLKGLFRGSVAAVPRAFIGSTSQLTSFIYCKELLLRHDILVDRPYARSFLASMVGGISVSLLMTPFDLVLTRLYNQGTDASGRGLLYKNYWDCVAKIFASEGFRGFYKGLGPNYLRLGPHTVLHLVFWDFFKDLAS